MCVTPPKSEEPLSDAPQAELRELFEKLQLTIAYQPEDQALEVEVTLYEDAWNETEGRPHIRAEDYMAPPVGLEPTPPAPEAGALSTELRGLKRQLTPLC
jgi:hypothetical protein